MARSKILLIGDDPNWAFHGIIKFITENLNHKYDFYVNFIYFNNIQYYRNPIKYIRYLKKWYLKFKFQRVLPDNGIYDVVIYLDWYMDITGNFKSDNTSKIKAKHIIKGIYTLGFPPEGYPRVEKNITINEFIKRYLSDADALVCGSRDIEEFYKPHFKHVFYANSVFNLDKFKPNAERPKRKDFSLTIGWTGNPNRKWKGFHEIIIPAIEKVSKLRNGIEFKTRFKGPMESLPEFYHGLDVVLIASNGDAGPSLFMEASLCGIPSISTKIGMPNEVIENEINGLFIERNVDSLVDAIIKVFDNKTLLDSMSRRIRNDFINKIGPDFQIAQWEALFEFVLNNN